MSVGGSVSHEIVYNPGSPIKVLNAYQLPKLISDPETGLYNLRTFLRRQLQVNIVSFNTNSGGRRVCEWPMQRLAGLCHVTLGHWDSC